MSARMHDEEVTIDDQRVRRLLDDQFPQLAGQPLRLLEPWGTDRALWRLGDDHVLRFPRISWAAGQVDFEAYWLPRLAPCLPVVVPETVAIGEPAYRYPFRWAVVSWIAGDPAGPETVESSEHFASDLARAVGCLHSAPVSGAPVARGRARPLAELEDVAAAAIESAQGLIDVDAAWAVWRDALAAEPYGQAPVWVHGDLDGNCLVREGRLSGIVDWGSACAGDPAVDVQVIWSPLFTPTSRERFLRELGVDDPTVTRSRGLAVQQACAALPYYLDTYPLIVARSVFKLRALGIEVRVPESSA